MSNGVINIIPTDLKTKRELKATINKLKDTILFEDKINKAVKSLTTVDESKSVLKVRVD